MYSFASMNKQLRSQKNSFMRHFGDFSVTFIVSQIYSFFSMGYRTLKEFETA